MQSYNHIIKSNISKLAFNICNELLTHKNPPVFLCVGSSKFVADSLGPMVGQLLTKKHNIKTFVYGNLKHNVNNYNIITYVNFIKQHHVGAPLIVIDSCLDALNQVGLIKFNKGKTLVGGYTNATAKYVGTYSVLGVVNTTGINSYLFLKSITLQTAINMATFVAESINYAFALYTKLKQDNNN